MGEAHRLVQDGRIDGDRPGGPPVPSGGEALGNGWMHGVPQMLECHFGLACRSSPHYGGAVVCKKIADFSFSETGVRMPHARPQDLPPGGGGRWPAAGEGFRSVQWGDMEVGFTTVDGPRDCTELYKIGGMPGGLCMCPHYGYIFTGTIRATYPGTGLPDDVATAGEAYFFPAGHILIYEEATQALEINPAFALQQCMDAMERTAQRFGAAQTAEGT
ncbi:hypothetical protein [Actinocorallia longicatena]|uniref:hypothetical protein n=1 Tax=Actinocorallia longicatena TaxID=111803 RepID=UPI0031D213FB